MLASRLRPDTLLERVRLQFTALFVLVALLGLLDLTRIPALLPNELIVFIGGHVALAAWGVFIYVRRGRHPAIDLLVPLLLAAIGAASGDYDYVFARLYVALLLAGLYGPGRRTARNAVLFLVGYEVAVYATHGLAGFTLAQLGSNVAGVAAITYVMHTLRGSLERQAATAERESALTSASLSLLSARSGGDVTDAALWGVSQLVDPDGTMQARISLWWQKDEMLEMVGLSGHQLDLSEVALETLPGDLVSAYRSGCLLSLGPDQMRQIQQACGVPHDFSHGLAVPAVSSGAPLGLLFIASHEPLDEPIVTSLERFVHEVALADVLVRRNRLLTAVVDHSADGIVLVSADGLIDFASPSVGELVGERVDTVIGEPLGTLLLRPEGEGFRPVASIIEVQAHADRLCITSPHGCHQIEATVSPLGEGAVVLNLRDVTDRRRLEQELAHVAFHDAVTDLPNRRMFFDRLTHAIDRAEREDGVLMVAVLDLDDFKNVNDLLGHDAGDQLLIETAARLRRTIRRGDTAARLGGDEFAVLLEGLRSPDEGIEVLQRIAAALRSPVELRGGTMATSASIGVSVSDDARDLLRDADVAMYAAKRAGKDQVVVFAEAMHADVREQTAMRNELHAAQETDQFRLEYQPIYDVGSGVVTGFEALLRWDHPERGPVAPDVFIPIAEATGAIVPLGRWVLRQACQQLADWRMHQTGFDALGISVNVSASQVLVPGFFDVVTDVLDDTGLDAASLTLEITESVLMDDPETAGSILARLRRTGVKVAIDDFGTGYSSFTYLQRFPVDVVKIDRSFISRITEGPEAAALAQAMTKLAESLHIDTTAEGVEHSAQLELLRSWSCTSAQGWLWAASMTPEALLAWLPEASLQPAIAPRAH